MRIWQFFYFVLISFMFISFKAALAEKEVTKEETQVVYEKKTVIDFSDVLISGELMKPDGIYVKKRKKTKFNPLIELRANFRPELIKSVSDL